MASRETPIKPLRMLKSAINKEVVVHTKDGLAYAGRLIMTDSTMNVVMRDCREINPESGQEIAKYGTVLLRGSQILYVVVKGQGLR